MEELKDGSMIKSTDAVEAYLLNLVQSYFESNKITTPSSREYIINKAVERMKEELNLDATGVVSVNGKTGVIDITLEELGGEPKIEHKMNAFNVHFGSKQGTACEGNDPRLSDKRIPLPHKHDISDIKGLDGLVSSISNKIDRNNSMIHSHPYLDVLSKIIYTGTKDSIDLADIEKLESFVNETLEKTRKEYLDNNTEIDNKISSIETKMSEVTEDIPSIENMIEEKKQSALSEAKQYVNEQTDAIVAKINEAKTLFATSEEIQEYMEKTKNNSCFVYSGEINVFSLDFIDGYAEFEFPEELFVTLSTNGILLYLCQVEVILSCTLNGKQTKIALPYFTEDGMLTVCFDFIEGKLIFATTFDSIPDNINNGIITYRIYGGR